MVMLCWDTLPVGHSVARVEQFIHESQNLYASGLEKFTYMQRRSEGAGEWCNHPRESQNLYASVLEEFTYMQRRSKGAGEWCDHPRESQNLYASGLKKSTYMQRCSKGAGEWCDHPKEQYKRSHKINTSNKKK